MNVNQCASVIYEHDHDFGDVKVIDTVNDIDNLLSSQKIDIKKLAHSSEEQQRELLALLDKFPECFSEKPGFLRPSTTRNSRDE